MRLKLTLARPGQPGPGDDILITVDTTVSVGDLAETIARCDPRSSSRSVPEGSELTVRIEGERVGGRVVPRSSTVADAGLRSGDTVALVPVAGRYTDAVSSEERAAVLRVVEGPDAGRSFPLRAGANQIGRDVGNDVRLTDPLVSKRHARVNITDLVEVIDLGSSNGVLIADEAVPRATLRAHDRILLGDSVIEIELLAKGARSVAPTVEFNRSPWLDEVYPGAEFTAPEPPKPPPRTRFPIIALLAPVLLGAVMFAVTKQAVTLLFIAFSPVMMLGNFAEGRIGNRKDYRAAVDEFHRLVAALADELRAVAVGEVATRQAEHPATALVAGAVSGRNPLLWTRRPDRRGFLELRVALGHRPSRTAVKIPARTGFEPALWQAVADVKGTFASVADVPLVATLTECGSVGVAGPRAPRLDCVRALLVQLVGLHSPAEVVVCAVVPSSEAAEWDWLKWLPHVSSDHSPLTMDHLASSPGAAVRLVAALEELVDERRARRSDEHHLPAVVLLVDGDAPVERSRLVELAELGSATGVHLIWAAPLLTELPAACRVFVEIDPVSPGRGAVGFVATGERVADVSVERLDKESAELLARSLAPVVDAGARVDDDSDLPRTVSLVTLLGSEAASSADHVVERWHMSDSIPDRSGGLQPKRRRKDHHLRALVGVAAGQGFVLDLREHGPHALVGGTTGSGKSEFLQSWVLGLAAAHSPARVTFLFVDYKGGAAFGECVKLPHAVGLVTDLSPYLVRRVLTSLNAEVRHREEILRLKKAKDLLELERRSDADAPPALLIVVDEFAALASDVPEFVDGVVNVAQRGRSLGLHLILATQRPAGVIKDNLRANTNLRVALRMADEDDSTDVVGTTQAALFDPGIPGRAVAKVGPGRLTPFQSGYVGGWTADRPPRPIIRIEDLRISSADPWEDPRPDETADLRSAPNDLSRVVATVVQANEQVGLPRPRRPWLDSLAKAYDLAKTPQSRNDSELIFGVADDPEHQRQLPVAFFPDRDGNMAVYGTGGSGKSGFLRALAVVAGASTRAGRCHVYGLDFGTRGLQILEDLPHVGAVINGDDDERVIRLLRFLRQEIDERAARFARVNAGNIEEYRHQTGLLGEPRILLLVDGLAAFRQAYEVGPNARWFDTFQGIAADGRQLGVHVVVSADRASVIPPALSSVIQRRLVLRLASDTDYALLDVPADALDATSPPGRGFLDGKEVQVAVLGRTANTMRQAAVLRQLAARLRDLSDGAGGPRPIERLRERIRLAELPASVEGKPVLGLADDTLGPFPFIPEGTLLVAGPAQSGKTTVLATIAMSVKRWRPGSELVYFGPSSSPLQALLPWSETAIGIDDAAATAKGLTDRIGADAASASSRLVIAVESLPEYLNTSAEMVLEELFKLCRRSGVFILATGETRSMASSWSLLQPFKTARHGIALQPDQLDGDSVFTTPFPRMTRADFPPGRGLYVRSNGITRVQCALPEVGRL